MNDDARLFVQCNFNEVLVLHFSAINGLYTVLFSKTNNVIYLMDQPDVMPMMYTVSYFLSLKDFKVSAHTGLWGYCTPEPYFGRLCVFFQKIKQFWTK